MLALVAAAAIWMGWQAWLAPTRIALLNFPEFQAARLVKSSPGIFVRAEVLPMDRLAQVRRYSLVLAFGRGLKLDDAQLEQLRAAGRTGTRIYVDGASNPQHDTLTTLRGPDLDAISAYLRGGGPVNYARLQTYARRVLDGKRLFADTVAPPQPIPQDVFFHLGDDAVFADFATFEQWLGRQAGWKPGRPRLALLTSVPGPFNANRDHVDAVIRAFEARGFEVVPISAVRQRLAFLKQVDPAAVVYMPHGRLTLGQADEARQWLQARNIPLFAAVSVFTEADKWQADQRSFDGGLLTMSVTLPEIDGATTPMAIAAQFRGDDGLRVFRALPQRLERFADLVQRTVALKNKANADKKLAIYYYKGPGQSALTAGDLEVMPSLYALLQRLRNTGYRVDGLPATEAEFAQLLQQRGPNIGPYAKGDFANFLRNADPAWVPASQLSGWCGKQIVQLLCDQVVKQFGPAPGAYLSAEGKVAVARVPLGNVVLLPQPLPGVGEDTFKIVHGTQSAPPWPYVASYLWTREVFGADAVMHFGTHGSLEFTPYKQVALSDRDWPDALIGGIPHFYLYTMGNVGEAMIAKRRSYATTISHLTPPLREGGTQSGYKQLADRLQAWDAADNSALKLQYAQDIQRQAVALGLHRDLSFDARAPWSETQLARLADHMETVEDARITAGLYTLGKPYAPQALDSTARLMGLDALVQALAELDVTRGTVRREQLDHSAWLARTYRPRAEALIVRAEKGDAPDRILAQVVQPAELQRAQAWQSAQRRPSDDELVSGLISMRESRARRPGASGGAADDATLRQHLARALADPNKREFLEGLRSDQKLKQALRTLDPEALQTARTVAKAIPAMAQALEIAVDPDVKPLLAAMQAEALRRKILGWLPDPGLQADVQPQARRSQQELLAQSRQYQSALKVAELATNEQAAQLQIDALDAPAQAQLLTALRFWQQAPQLPNDLPDQWQQRREHAAANIERLVKVLDRRVAQRAADEQRMAQAVLTLRERLRAIPRYRSDLADSPARELAALTNALAGGFTSPSSGGDPLINPAALPTGRNLFAIDAEKTPSEQAWVVGRRLVDQMLAQHRATHGGEWPSKIAFTLWAGDFIHTEGTSIAQILYLLGVSPVRDPFGRVSGLRLIPREELGRPRVDVVVQTSGQLRDLAASRLYLINQAVAMAAQAREHDNVVAQGVQAVERKLKEHGASPADARRFSSVRVFGGVNGNYGTGIMGMVEAGDRWQTRAEVARTYLDNMGAAYGEGELWSAFQPGAFEAALQGTQVVVQPLTSNTWGPISLDHVYEFMGGLNLAVREVTGQEPAAYFSDFRNASRPAMREAKAAIAVEARATVLNPAYIKGMSAGGASSAEVFAETSRNLFGWNVMKPSAVPPELWDALDETYVRDTRGLGVHQFFERANPYALQEMTAVMLETARKGYWQPGDARLREVARLHADLVARFGASGTRFVNDNQALRGFIADKLTPASRKAYENAVQAVNQGANIATDKATVLRKADDPPAAAKNATGNTAQTRVPNAAGKEQTVVLRPSVSAAAVLGGALMVLATLVWWLRRRHRGTHS